MKRKGLPIGVGIALIALMIVAAIALLLFQTAQNGWVVDTKNVTRMAIVIIGLLLSLIKLITRAGGSRSLSVYEKAYKKEIGNAFSRPDTKKYKRTLLRATALYNENNFDAAIKLLSGLESKCNTSDDYCAVLFFLALCYSDSGMTDEGILEYEKLLKYNEKNSTAWSNLGILYKNTGRSADADRCYRNAVLHDPNDAYAWNNIAQSYVSAGKWKKAIGPAERALSIKANLYQADSALALAYCALGDREKSKIHYDRAVMNGSDSQKLSKALKSIASGYFPFGDEASGVEDEAIARAIGFLRRDSATPMVKIGLPAPDDGNYTVSEARLSRKTCHLTMKATLCVCLQPSGAQRSRVFPTSPSAEFFASMFRILTLTALISRSRTFRADFACFTMRTKAALTPRLRTIPT